MQQQSVREVFEFHIDNAGRGIGKLAKLELVCEQLGLDGYLDIISDIWPTTYLDPMRVAVTLSQSGTERVADFFKAMLTKMGSLKKTFTVESRLCTMSGRFMGVDFTFQLGIPSTCTIEEVEEDVTIPAVEAQPERVEKKKVLRMVGDCDPLLAPPSPPPSEAEEVVQ